MNQRILWVSILSVMSVHASRLPKVSVQALVRALQDTNVEIRTAAASALAKDPDESDIALKPLETALVASDTAAEQEALVEALVAIHDKDTAKRLTESLANPQFTWGKGAKARAVDVIAKIGDRKKNVKWLTDLAGNETDASVRIAAIKALGDLGAPPKKEKKD